MPVIRPDKANVSPADLGTKSIAEVNAAWEQIKGPSDRSGKIRPDNFSKLTNEERVKAVEHGRRIANDRYGSAKGALFNIFAIYMINKGLKKLLSGVAGTTGANILTKLIIIASLYHRWGAWSLLSKGPYKGPKLYPFFGALLTMAKEKERMHNFLMEDAKTAGFDTLEIPVPFTCFVTLMDPRDREYVLKTNPWNFLKNRENDPACFERVFAEVLGRGIFSTDGSEWLSARKIASHMFSGKALQTQMEDVFNKHADRVLQLLKTSAADRNRVIDMQDIYQSAVFDAFCEIAFGVHPNCIESAIEGTRPQFLISFDRAQQIASLRIVTPPLEWNMSRIIGMLTGLGKEGELIKHINYINDYIYKIIDDRLKETDISSRNDLLSLYIQYSRAQKEPFTREDYRDIIANFMIAGRDTTSCTLTFATKFLAENRDVLRRLEEEGLFELGKSSPRDHGGRRVVSWEDSRTIPYADAVVNEVLRLAPPVGDDFRITIDEDVLPSGLQIRPGTRVGILNLAIGRDPRLWSNADTFEPERWMKYDANGVPQPIKRVDEYVHPIFFAGRRLCLGKDMARFEAIVFMSKLFEELHFHPVTSKDPQYVTGPVIFIKEGLNCTVTSKKRN